MDLPCRHRRYFPRGGGVMETTIKGVRYRIGKLAAFDQLKIARKLAPTAILIGALAKAEAASSDTSMLTLLILSHLSDADSEQVMALCLAVVTRMEATGAAKIWSPGGLMFSDIEMMDMLKLTADTIVDNLGSFFLSALADLEAKTTEL